jgi:hypothetical protein
MEEAAVSVALAEQGRRDALETPAHLVAIAAETMVGPEAGVEMEVTAVWGGSVAVAGCFLSSCPTRSETECRMQ